MNTGSPSWALRRSAGAGRIVWVVVAYSLIAVSGLSNGCKSPSAPEPTIPATFTSLQTNIFTPTCATSGCHSGSQAAALLVLDSGASYQALMDTVQNDAARPSYPCRVIPSKPDSSFIVAKITGHLTPEEGEQMPQRLKALPQYEIDAITEWIKEGAKNN